MSALHYLQTEQLAQLSQQRLGEVRLASVLRFPDPALSLMDNLTQQAASGARFVLVGIPEDIGPRANCGLGGADLGFQAFLSKFLNLQANAVFDASDILLLGNVDCVDLQQQSNELRSEKPADLALLRQLCQQLDTRVYNVLSAIFASGLTPIIIGGGHNNALPILQALSEQHRQAVNCINLDPHADFRTLEGRHSGNGFSYAMKAGLLQHYLVLGLHQQKNNAASLQALQDAGADFISYQQIFVEQQLSWSQAISQSMEKALSANTPLALELDTDSITAMPASALNYSGISVSQAEQAVYQLAKIPQTAYLHLAEASPAQHPAGLAAGLNQCGQVLSQLVQAFILGKQQQAPVVG